MISDERLELLDTSLELILSLPVRIIAMPVQSSREQLAN